MINTIIECDYCEDKLKEHDVINVCKVEDINDKTISVIHLCSSCYEYYVVEYPEKQEIKLLEHHVDTYNNLLSKNNGDNDNKVPIFNSIKAKQAEYQRAVANEIRIKREIKNMWSDR